MANSAVVVTEDTKTVTTTPAPFSGVGVKLAPEQRIKSVGQATPEDMVLINAFALEPLTAKDVCVYTMKVANDAIDRDGERFNLDCLTDFATTLPGKGLLEAHEWGPVGIGLFFQAWVEADSGTNWLMGKCYLLKADEEAAEMIVKINGGVAKWVSIGFHCPDRVMIQQQDGAMYHEYRRGPQGEPCESLEASLVFLGAQYDASVVKSMTATLEAKVKGITANTEDNKQSRLVKAFASLLTTVFGEDVKTPGKLPETEQAAPTVPATTEDEMNEKDIKDLVAAAVAAGKVEIVALIDEVKAAIDTAKAEFGTQVKAVTDQVSALDVSVKAVKPEAVAELGTKVAALETGVKEFETAGGLIMDRIEGVEAILGMATADDGSDVDPAAVAATVPVPAKVADASPKTAKAVFGNTIIPAELRK